MYRSETVGIFSDFPLSRALPSGENGRVRLSLAHLQLAAQVPSQWLRDDKAYDDCQLAIKKVIYRALLQIVLQRNRDQGFRNSSEVDGASDDPGLRGIGETIQNRRLGKLNNAAYQDWQTFVTHALKKMDVKDDELGQIQISVDERRGLEQRLSVLHVLRCLLGPLIESLIILDRYDWLRESLAEAKGKGRASMKVELSNIFDQRTGSARNIAIVIRPEQGCGS